ncbi:MAG TPA: helix-turn-helix domain-containing protein [Stellaceae bacterium]|nr:helix-turn-helix domain-containing protein [Stellaceae bacterium]
MTTRSPSQRRALGDFLRAQRARLAPASLGFAAGRRRRTPGLRREEVAQACGMSATWYTWLEQGRDVSASPEALAALAGALHLTPAERAYLFALAARPDPAAPEASGNRVPEAPPALAEAVAAIAVPAYVLDRCWTALSWNKPAERLFLGWLDRGAERNLLRYVFLDPMARRVIPDWSARARRVLAEFRAESSGHLDDPALVSLVTELARKSPLFARGWGEHEVVARIGGERLFDHPRDGILAFEQVVFALALRPDFKLVMLVPREKPARRARLTSRQQIATQRVTI